MPEYNREIAHWVAPTTLLTSFIAGIGFAIGHHLFYARLQGQRIENVTFTQQYNTAVGTAFAFLARAALVIAVATTYWQVFFKRLHRSLPISTIDSLAGLMGALKEFLSLGIYRASPLLVALALLGWMIPIAMIFPPATLTVVSTNTTNGQDFIYKTPNYTIPDAYARISVRYGGGIKRNSAPSHYMATWLGPTSQLRRRLISVAYQGQLPTFTAPEVNSSYVLQFNGPAVSCQNIISDSIIADLDAAVFDSTFLSDYNYVSWTPNSTTTVPFSNGSVIGPFPIGGTLGYDPNSDVVLYVASRGTDKWSVIKCSLHDASYAVSFFFENGKQSIEVSDYRILNSILLTQVDLITGKSFALSAPQDRPYFAVMDLLGETLTGTMWHARGNGYTTPDTNSRDHTRVLETNLAFSQELSPLYGSFTGSDSPPNATSPSPLASMIEELVQNMTISILTVPELLNTQEDSTTMSVTTFYNVYNYNWERLALAYAIAIGLTFIAVLIGMYIIISTGSSYSNRFSTILRMSRYEELDVLIEEQDRRGQDPLPKHIGKARFMAVRDTYRGIPAMISPNDDDRECHAMKNGQ
jgi:hypothetical protein